MGTSIFQVEKRLWNRGFKRVVCLDEAGRGSLAGPVVACAVLTTPGLDCSRSHLNQIKDSKKMTARQREKFYGILTSCPNIKWEVGRVSEKVIDKINILEATKIAMIKAVKKFKSKPNFLIVDGNFKINSKIPQKAIIKADEKVFSCMAASIIAKVTRDRIMEKYHQKYPRYCFNQHKGYPTLSHRKMLKRYGRCAIHRNSFNYHGCTKEKTHKIKKK
jgi:ribonuclease HII